MKKEIEDVHELWPVETIKSGDLRREEKSVANFLTKHTGYPQTLN